MEPPERLRTAVFDSHQSLAHAVAARVAEVIRERQREGKSAVLGLATGSTPVGVYRELVRMHQEEGLSFRGVVTFNLDEYYPMAPENLHSYHRFMWENFFQHVDIDPALVHIPDGSVSRDRLPAGRRGGGTDAGSEPPGHRVRLAETRLPAGTRQGRLRTSTGTRASAAPGPATSSGRARAGAEAAPRRAGANAPKTGQAPSGTF